MATAGSPTYYRDSLNEVNAAITAIATRGQRYRIGDRELWRGDLEWLTAERRRLEPLAAREGTGGIRIRRVIPL
jgi:hypothetical protein